MKLGVIGAGNMATAIIKGIISSGKINVSDIYVSDKDTKKLGEIKNAGVNVSENNSDVYANSEVIIFAVKPNIYPAVLKEAAMTDMSGKLIISIAPGITTKKIEAYFEGEAKVVRTMPNTPAMVGEGMSVLCAGTYAEEKELDLAKSIFECVGKAEIVKEELMDAVVAVSGSSPAYVFMLIEAMADAAVSEGLMRPLAYKLASQAVLGSAKMVLETKKHPGELKDMVCSPAGTTIDAVAVLEKRGFRNSVIEAMRACTEKSKLLGKDN